MNKRECDVLISINEKGYTNQRELSMDTGYSLGSINKAINILVDKGCLDDNYNLTKKSKEIIEKSKPQKAIILAAGFGMRMVPINLETPKALLEVHGETLIERLICQLHEVGIKDIYIVVGFMKERFEYLIDMYNVSLIVNSDYAKKNNLHSLALAKKHISNAYIVPCDIWCKENPFSKQELYSWYAVRDDQDYNSQVRVNRKNELVLLNSNEKGNSMTGLSYICSDDYENIYNNLLLMDSNPRYNDAFWEDSLYENGKMIAKAKIVNEADIVAINTYEHLREIDLDSNHLKTDAISIIAETLEVKENQIEEIKVLKKGMTNRSFMFKCNDKKYIMRIPGEGTSMLINRQEEASVYQELNGKNICDQVVYMNPNNGYKITEFVDNARVCDAFDEEDVAKCMKKLRAFHEQKLEVNHKFDLFNQIDYYENLWGNVKSEYRDYNITKENIFSLKDYIDENVEGMCLTHIDAVPDNFLFYEKDGKEEIRLIDWEYAGMQDPHVDIAMFAIYAGYNRKEIDNLIDLYFTEGCSEKSRIKIYCYIAACGLLWSNWCEYKRIFGVEFGEYSLNQYRYAKEYYKIAKNELEERGIVACIE